MKSIQVFDPALCCSSGVCGTDVDQKLVDFSADVDWARQQGLAIERFNLAQQPMAFADNAAVRGLLERSGEAALPITLVDGDVAFAGRYPTRADLARWLGSTGAAAAASPTGTKTTPTDTATSPAGAAAAPAGQCCSGGACC